MADAARHPRNAAASSPHSGSPPRLSPQPASPEEHPELLAGIRAILPRLVDSLPASQMAQLEEKFSEAHAECVRRLKVERNRAGEVRTLRHALSDTKAALEAEIRKSRQLEETLKETRRIRHHERVEMQARLEGTGGHLSRSHGMLPGGTKSRVSMGAPSGGQPSRQLEPSASAPHFVGRETVSSVAARHVQPTTLPHIASAGSIPTRKAKANDGDVTHVRRSAVALLYGGVVLEQPATKPPPPKPRHAADDAVMPRPAEGGGAESAAKDGKPSPPRRQGRQERPRRPAEPTAASGEKSGASLTAKLAAGHLLSADELSRLKGQAASGGSPAQRSRPRAGPGGYQARTWTTAPPPGEARDDEQRDERRQDREPRRSPPKRGAPAAKGGADGAARGAAPAARPRAAHERSPPKRSPPRLRTQQPQPQHDRSPAPRGGEAARQALEPKPQLPRRARGGAAKPEEGAQFGADLAPKRSTKPAVPTVTRRRRGFEGKPAKAEAEEVGFTIKPNGTVELKPTEQQVDRRKGVMAFLGNPDLSEYHTKQGSRNSFVDIDDDSDDEELAAIAPPGGVYVL